MEFQYLADVQMHALLHGSMWGMIFSVVIMRFGDACSHGTTPMTTIGASRQEQSWQWLKNYRYIPFCFSSWNGAWGPKCMAQIQN